MVSWCHELIVCRKVPGNNLTMRLMMSQSVPPRLAPNRHSFTKQMIVTSMYPFPRRADPTTLPPSLHAFPPPPLAFICIDKVQIAALQYGYAAFLSSINSWLLLKYIPPEESLCNDLSPVPHYLKFQCQFSIYTVLNLALNRIHTEPSMPPNFIDAMCFLPSPPRLFLTSSVNGILILIIIMLFLYLPTL